jgi:hypothetical protein
MSVAKGQNELKRQRNQRRMAAETTVYAEPLHRARPLSGRCRPVFVTLLQSTATSSQAAAVVVLFQ